jgi:hypothetical protein
MKTLAFPFLLALSIILLNACKSSGGRTIESADGVAGIVEDLNSEFGDKASYTSVGMGYHKDLGTTVSATGTKDPSSNKLIKKQKTKGNWQDLSEITLEIEGEAKPADFMFTLKDVDNFKQLPTMIKSSVDKIKKEKNIDVVVENVTVNAPQKIDSEDDNLRYLIYLAPEQGGTTFTMIFDNKGNFQRMMY